MRVFSSNHSSDLNVCVCLYIFIHAFFVMFNNYSLFSRSKEIINKSLFLLVLAV